MSEPRADFSRSRSALGLQTTTRFSMPGDGAVVPLYRDTPGNNGRVGRSVGNLNYIVVCDQKLNPLQLNIKMNIRFNIRHSFNIQGQYFIISVLDSRLLFHYCLFILQ